MTPPSMNPQEPALLHFACHFCGIELKVPMELGGETAPCPSCGLLITAPALYTTASPEPYLGHEGNQTQWEAVLSEQQEETLRSSEVLGRPEPAHPVVGVGQVIAAHPSVRGAILPVNGAGRNGSRGTFFPLTVTLLAIAIMGLSGVLLWRSELWRPGWSDTLALSSSPQPGAKPSAKEEPGTSARERAEVEMQTLAKAVAPVWPAETALDEKRQSARNPVSQPLAARESPASPVVASKKPAIEPALAASEAAKPAAQAVAPKEAAIKPSVAASEAAKPAGKSPASAELTIAAKPEPSDESKNKLAPAQTGQKAPVPVPPADAPVVASVVVASSKAPPAQPVPAPKPAESSPIDAPAATGPQAPEVIPVAGMAPEDAAAVAANLEPEEGMNGAGTALERAREAIRRFLEAERWQERVPFIFGGEAKQASLRDYFQNRPDSAVKDFRLDFFHSEAGKEGAPTMFVFFLTLEHEEDGYPVIVKADQEGKQFGVDWDLYVEFRDRHFAGFVEKKEAAPREFRVVIQRVTYWEEDRDQIPGIEDLVCYKVDPPYPGYTQYAFVEKNSEEGKRMVEGLSWETDPLAARVRMNWAKFPDGKAYLRVTDLVARSWAD